MRIKFIVPPSHFLQDEKVFPFLGVLYIVSYLKKKDIPSEVIDLNNTFNLNKALINIKADIFGITSTTPQFPNSIKILEILRKKNPNSLYVIGGAHASAMPEECLKAGFDIVVVGEGEKAFYDIIINNNRDKVINMPYEKNIDIFPYPARGLIDIKSYKYYINKYLATTVLTSRGCPFACKFCANSVWGKTVRFMSAEYVFGEIKELKEKYKYKAIMFFDDTFTINLKRLYKICDFLRKESMIFRCFVRTDTVNKDQLKYLKEAGCVEIGIGLESGSQKILDIVSKATHVQKGIDVIKAAHKIGLRVKAFLMIGLPGESEETVKETIKWLEIARPDDFDISIFIPYAGSDIYRNKEKYDIQFNFDYSKSWYKGKLGELKSMVSTSELSMKRITELRDYIHRRFKKI